MIPKRTITVGIPAYNEAGNIRALVQAVTMQRLIDATLLEILVIVDGCTDDTVAQIQAVTDPRIRIIEYTGRRGLIAGQNTLVREAHGDILVLFDADVLPVGVDCLEHMVAPLLTDPTLGLTSPLIVPAPGRGLLERILVVGHALKNDMYRYVNKGQNVYLCHGRARAFSHKFYQHIRWPVEYVEDAYSYFACRQAGLGFAFVPTATVQFRSPTSWYDHVQQSLRFIHGKNHISEAFPTNEVRQAYALPWSAVWRATLRSFTRRPLETVLYIGIVWLTRMMAWTHRQQDHSTFAPAVTSKRI